MPKIDPVTGVRVLTFPEFMAKEAELSGRTYEEENEAFWTEWDAAAEEDRQNYEDNALEILRERMERENRWRAEERIALARRREQFKDDPERAKRYEERVGEYDPEPLPTELIELLDCDYQPSFTGERLRLRARCRRDDGEVGVLTYTREYWSGTRLEPPEEEEVCVWEEVIPG